jgi:hypothetical protein
VDGTATVWGEWRFVLGFTGAAKDSPVLSDPVCFAGFLTRFGAARSIRGGATDEFRGFLRGPDFPLEELLSDPGGRMIDKQDQRLRRRFGTVTHGSTIKSPLSKVAWALRPAIFPDYDSHIRRGLEHLASGRKFEEYEGFASAFNSLAESLSADLRRMCAGRCPVEAERAFGRKVLTAGLARIGRQLRAK